MVGWFFEVLYIVCLIAWFVLSREKRAQRAAEQAQRQAELAASGAVYATRGRSLVGLPARYVHREPPVARDCGEVPQLLAELVDEL